MQILLEALLVVIISGTPLYFFFNLGAVTVLGICLALGIWLTYILGRRISIAGAIRSATVIDSEVAQTRRARVPRAMSADIDPSPAMDTRRPKIARLIISIVFIFHCALSLFILATSAVTRSITGPWEAVPPIFFSVYFLQSLLLVTALILGVPRVFAGVGVALHSLVSLAVIPLVYPLGFGFDPVIHQQAERLIAETGILLPKTLYYTGHYVLLVFLSSVTSLPLSALDRFLLPVLASLSVPFFAIRAFAALKLSTRTAGIGALFCTLALVPAIASPTPWGWSVFLFFVFILASIEFFADSDKPWVARSLSGGVSLLFFFLLALAATFIHPIAGLPLVAATALFTLIKYQKVRPLPIAAIVLLGGIAVPVAFLLNSSGSAQLTWNPPALPTLANLLPWRFDALRDPLHTASAFFPLAVFCGFLWRVVHFRSQSAVARAHALLFALLSIGYVIMRFFLSFPFLIDYEQSSYANRFLTLLFLSIFPLAFAGVAGLIERLFDGPALLRVSGAFLIAASVSGVLYLSYPKNDPYESSHAYNISREDIAIVRRIAADAKGIPHIVLANQVASAAALKTFGFAIRYPIPTSSPLYESYLAFLAKTDRAVIEEVLQREGVTRAYFVIHDYEPRAKNIARAAASHSDPSFSVTEGAVRAYRFTISNNRISE